MTSAPTDRVVLVGGPDDGERVTTAPHILRIVRVTAFDRAAIYERSDPAKRAFQFLRIERQVNR